MKPRNKKASRAATHEASKSSKNDSGDSRMSIAEKHETMQHDCYVVVLPIEFLPGMKSTVNASLEFSDEDVARKSLEHVQKQYPNARLSAQTWFDLNDELDA